MSKYNMNEDIKKYDVFFLTKNGKLIKTDKIKSINDYNHYYYSLHHYVLKQSYEKNKKWYDERGIKQKLILIPIFIHEQIHNIAIKNITDEEFRSRFKISRWDLLFNRKYSSY